MTVAEKLTARIELAKALADAVDAALRGGMTEEQVAAVLEEVKTTVEEGDD